jgi:hypothetical protein
MSYVRLIAKSRLPILLGLAAYLTAGGFASAAHNGVLSAKISGTHNNPSSASVLTSAAYGDLTQRVVADQSVFFVYQDADSGFNHGFPSGFIGATQDVSVNVACIDDTTAAQGCSTDTTLLDRTHGTVAQISFAPLAPTDFAGLDFEEPKGYVSSLSGVGYNLTGASQILFSVRSPTGITLQFGVGGQTTQPVSLPQSNTYATACIAVQGVAAQICPANAAYKLDLAGPIDLTSVHLLFTVVTNGELAPGGGTVLLDNIYYDPVPIAQTSALSLPLSTATFGVVPAQQAPIPPDQANRNPATIYEASLTILALLVDGDTANAKIIADALVYALAHDNSGDPLPAAPDGATGLHNAYEAGDLTLLNSQGSGGGQAGQIRLAGFSASQNGCGTAGFCLEEDGATGGNNAFAILALLKMFQQSQNQSYLNAALTIGDWISEQMPDTSGTGFGGYFQGYPDMGMAKILQLGKSTENNADIFAAFTALAQAETRLDNPAAANNWHARAKIAGDFVIAMFDASRGCFYAGTVPAGTPASFGVDPTGPTQGNDVVNRFNFFDVNSFSWLALSTSKQYGQAIPWSSVISCLNQFQVSVSAAGSTFSGYSLITPADTPGPQGVAWEFTGQAAVLISLSGGDPTAVLNNIAEAQAQAPFGDQAGLVAATLASGDTLPPLQQCLTTPFQCIPERVGLAATAWAIFAENAYNPLSTNAFYTDTHDFNADGYSDVLWRDDNGNLATWLMNGAQITGSAGVGGASPSVWSVVGQRDFNGDGTADLLWHDTGGNVAMWFISGAQVVGSAGVGNASPNLWSIAGTGDFNGDGTGDILWHDTSGNVAIWLMNGSSIVQSCGVGNASASVWSIAATGDFNGDGMTDILWHDNAGNVAIWFMNGCSILQSSGVGNANPTVWSIAGTGDFNGDGKSDILWHDSSGNVAMWLMNGASILQSSGVGNVNPSVWSIAETADFNGDGKSDILWHDTSGDLAVWEMNGASILNSAGIGNASASVWTVQGQNAD